MKVKHNELELQEGNPFANCKLGRRRDAMALNDLIGSIEGGGTIAINGAWGFGKTTFLRMWKQDLEQRDYRVILFNAWETDFSTEPLVSILGELGEIVHSDKKKQYDRIAQRAINLGKKGLPTLVSLWTGISSIGDLFRAIISSFDSDIEDYAKHKQEFQTIKNSLEDLVLCDRSSKPVIFIVDELDRCRPDYAVEVLEKIKHLFSVNNLIFVLSVDKEQLCHAIKGYYGSSELNASEYLRRFIDIEYDLGCSDYKSIVRHFFEYFDLIFSVPDMEESNSNDNIDEISKSIALIALISEDQRLSMRQVEKWIVHLSPIDASSQRPVYASGSYYVHYQLETIVLLTFFKFFSPKIYQGIKDRSYSLPKLIQDTKDLFPNRLTQELGVNTPINPILSVGLCTLYLLYHLDLYFMDDLLTLNNNKGRQKVEEVLAPFFHDTSTFNEGVIINNVVESFNLRSISTDDLVSIVDKLGWEEVKSRWNKFASKF